MNLTRKAITVAAGAALFVPALSLAQTDISVSASSNVSAGGTTVGASANTQARITKAQGRADQEIKRRIDMLNAMNAKVQAMTNVSADEKSSLSSAVSAEVSDLTALQAKIDADTDLSTLKTDIHSIATSYRIFLLVIPRARIDVAADRIQTVAGTMATFAGKLQTRISAATGDTSSLVSRLAGMNAKIADAQAQASAAVSALALLQPDNGDKTVESANAAAVKDARAKIQAALQDLKTARQDAGAIVRALHQMRASANASAHAAAEASSSTQ